jgi:hypothetical protein
MADTADADLMRRRWNEAFSVGASRATPDADGPRADIKKLLLVAGLGLLSWAATYIGMMELIEANVGDLTLIHRLVIGFSVAMLMIMIIWLLDQMFAPLPALTKLVYICGYIFLTIISVGFGFGFYWKVLESRGEASRSAVAAVSQVQTAMHAAGARLNQLQATLVQLSQISAEKAELERSKGTSCPNSRPGDGPRRKMREEDAARFAFASDFVANRAGAVKAELQALDTDLALIANNDPKTIDAKTGNRNEFMKTLARKLDMSVAGFNALRTDPQLRQLRSELADRAERSTFGDPKKGGFVCPDPQLQSALRGTVRAIDQLPELESPKIAAVEGSEATIEAFRRLTATFYGLLSFRLPPSAEELRELQQKAVQSVEGGGAKVNPAANETGGLSRRDYIPLAIAIFVDFCLLLVAMGRPVNRLGSLLPKMRDAERSPVNQILSRFSDIHRDEEVRQTFEVFRHVVFDQAGTYYVAVPLDAPSSANPRNPDQRGGFGAAEMRELQIEAHLLANLFTSFEKERIFTRVYSPLLTTRVIQKKLARQGSKFAGCDAFRLYRFRDGAWPEIILGAVMGAARRAEEEDEQMRRSNTTQIAPTPEPTLSLAPQRTEASASLTGQMDRTASRESDATSWPARAPRRAAGAETQPRPDEQDAARFGPYARSVASEREGLIDLGADIEPANNNTQSRSVASYPSAVTPAPTVVSLPLRAKESALRGPQGNSPAHGFTPTNFADSDRSPRLPGVEDFHAERIEQGPASTPTFATQSSIAEIARAIEPPHRASHELESASMMPPTAVHATTEDSLSDDDALEMARRLRPAMPAD